MSVMPIHAIARICHEANRAYCIYLDDHSQAPWEQAPSWQQESAINGVTFAIEHPEATPEDSHNNWSRGKADAGWTYGPVKDEVARTHPCLVPYHELPLEQRLKDSLFQGVVKALTSQEK